MCNPDTPFRLLSDIRSAHRLADRRGLAMAATLIVLALIGVISAFLFSGAMSSLRTAMSDYQNARTFYAAEAAAEAALAQLEDRLRDGSLSDDDLATIAPPELEPFSFDGFEVSKVDTARVETITDGPYSGLYALTQDVEIYAPAEDPTGAMSAVILAGKARAIPLFQFGVFYEEDLEATNGPPMEFVGRVHSNGNIYLSSDNAWYREPITTPGKVFHRRKDQDESKDGVFIDDSEATEVLLDFDSESTPDFEAFKAESCDKFDCRLQTEAFGVEPLELPLGEGVEAYELLRPRDEVDDGDGAKEVKFSWNSDARVTVDLTDVQARTALCGGASGKPDWVPAITIERDGQQVPDEATTCDIFAWQWSDFYDGREEELKDVLNVDIEELDDWVDGDADRQMELIYIEFIVPETFDDLNDETMDLILDGYIDPAVRVIKGSQLPNRLTVATAWPIYSLGDYNTNDKKPAALVGDGITILSEAWEDDENRPDDDLFEDCEGQIGSLGDPCNDYEDWADDWDNERSAETTVNAAILAGHWATPCDWAESGCSEGYEDWYGGGIENFPRFLENWREPSDDKIIFHYTGALVSPFTSQKTTGTWNGSYYVPPERDWAFDTDFRDPELLPPGTPNVGSVLRSAFREAF